MNLLEQVHERYVYGRRIRRLSAILASLVPPDCSLLDVGCGEGRLAWSLLERRPDLNIEGVDILVREKACVPVKAFDGANLPYSEASFDGVMLVDVLHHTHNPLSLLREAVRVSRRWLVVKDHVLAGPAAAARLRFMDDVGNARHGVSLPYNYLGAGEWAALRHELNVKVATEFVKLYLYPWPMDYVFGAGLHFATLWERAGR
ncbi:MAG: class I SAM-dependent methyltransferase [Terriglobales bacterium]